MAECYVCIIATLSILKNKYVGFCAKTFPVQDSNEATHLNNVKVQSSYKKYKISEVPERMCMGFYAV